jgi:signal transduction histidine kinase
LSLEFGYDAHDRFEGPVAFPVQNEMGAWITAKLNSRLRMAGFALFVAAMAYALAFAGDLFSLSPKIAAVHWPANAFQIAVMLLLPRRTWPLLIAAHVVGGIVHGFQIHLTTLMTVMFTLADVVVFLVAGFGLSRVFDGIPRLDSLKALAKYFLVAVLLAPAISAFVSGFGTPGLYWTSCRIWFLLNALTFLTFGPAIFGWLSPLPEWTRTDSRWWLEAGAQLGALLLLGYFIVLSPWRVSSPALLYSLVPLLLWAALRFGSAGVSTSMVIVAVISVWGAVHGHGPFAGSDPQRNSLSLLLFLLFAATPFMLLAAVVEERERARLIQRALSGKLISAQEQERRRIARELHDDISQKLAVMTAKVEQTDLKSNNSPAAMQRCIEDIKKQCAEVAREVRSLSHQLHSSKLEYLGVAAAIRGFCNEFSETHGLSVEFTGENVPRHLPNDVALCLFRITQEALSNARKHSGTRSFTVELIGNANGVRLEVRDRGAGFDVGQVRRVGGLGLVSMEERVHLVGGSLSVESRPGAGTLILAVVPLAAPSSRALEEKATRAATRV